MRIQINKWKNPHQAIGSGFFFKWGILEIYYLKVTEVVFTFSVI